MGTWRLRWSLAQLTPSEIIRHRGILKTPWRFYWILLVKLFPHFWRRALVMEPWDGKQIPVHEFMTLMVYKEIFVDHCYDVALVDIDRPSFVDVGANTGLFALRMKQL